MNIKLAVDEDTALSDEACIEIVYFPYIKT